MRSKALRSRLVLVFRSRIVRDGMRADPGWWEGESRDPKTMKMESKTQMCKPKVASAESER